MSARGTSFVFTDFDAKNIKDGYAKVFKEYDDIIRGLAWGREKCPKTGNDHNQCYIQFYSQQRGSKIQKIVKNKCHYEVMHGSIKDNENYCSKEGKYTEIGKFVSRGYRSDLHSIKDDLKAGASMYDIMENYTGDFVRYHSGIKAMAGLVHKKQRKGWRDVEVTVLQGKAGTGKTRYVYDKHGYENVYKFDAKHAKTDFWGMYDGEDVLLIDDFNGWIQYSYMLQVLDGYPLQMNVKNGTTWANFTKVYITSNVSVSRWYSRVQDNFWRRIGKCLEVSKGNTEPLLTEVDKRVDKDYGGYGLQEESGYDGDPLC